MNANSRGITQDYRKADITYKAIRSLIAFVILAIGFLLFSVKALAASAEANEAEIQKNMEAINENKATIESLQTSTVSENTANIEALRNSEVSNLRWFVGILLGFGLGLKLLDFVIIENEKKRIVLELKADVQSKVLPDLLSQKIDEKTAHIKGKLQNIEQGLCLIEYELLDLSISQSELEGDYHLVKNFQIIKDSDFLFGRLFEQAEYNIRAIEVLLHMQEISGDKGWESHRSNKLEWRIQSNFMAIQNLLIAITKDEDIATAAANNHVRDLDGLYDSIESIGQNSRILKKDMFNKLKGNILDFIEKLKKQSIETS